MSDVILEIKPKFEAFIDKVFADNPEKKQSIDLTFVDNVYTSNATQVLFSCFVYGYSNGYSTGFEQGVEHGIQHIVNLLLRVQVSSPAPI